MTREEILAMPAGRELDNLVARRVMGAPNEDYTFTTWGKGPFQYDMDGNEVTWRPSKRIQDAWEVVEKMREHQLFVDTRTCSDFYEVWVTRWGVDPELPASTETVSHPSLPLAICRAALLVAMEETP